MAFALHGERVVLRDWRDSDLPAWVAMSADPEVMRFFNATLSEDEARATMDRIRARAASDGFCFWALEVPGVHDFAGFVGITRTPYETPFTPCVEVGWRLARSAWGKGYATEGAKLSLAYGFQTLQLDEIVSQAVETNYPSRAVMERIGMRQCIGEEFDHPLVPEGSPNRRHVLYRLSRTDWQRQQA
jgi:ribosomal-protein-alanine N-acetyltransferase